MTDWWASDPVAAPAASSEPARVTVRPSDAKPAENWWAADPAVSTTGDVAKSLGVGVGKGAIGLAGLGGDAWSLIEAGMTKAGLDPETVAAAKTALHGVPAIGSLLSGPTSGQIQKTVEGVTGDFYKSQTTAGKYAQTIGEFAPGALVGPGGLARRAVSTVAAGLGSEAAGQATEGTAFEPYARVAGAVAGGLAPAAGQRLITPLPANAERQAAVNTLRNEGVTDLTAGQATGRKGLQYFESEMGGGAAANMQERQAEQFTRAALRRAGEDAPRATPEVVDNAFSRIGQQFDDLAARTNVRLDLPLGNEMVRIERTYQQLVPPNARAPVVADTIRDIGQAAAQTGGVMDGATYQALRSRLDRAGRASIRDPQLSQALFDLRGAIDDAMARSLTNANDRMAWRTARREYRNMLVIEKAATAAGENAAQGLISPSALRNATVSSQGRRNYARGQGDFSDLARSAEAVMKPLPNSGTAPRLAAQTMGAGLGAVLGGSLGGAMEGGLGAVAGTVIPRIAGRAAVSAPVRNYLGNQLLAGQAPASVPQSILVYGTLARLNSKPVDSRR